ncbi:hypothetical protein lerEdw1_005836 [Lerista edwardsae]|nr:hypothetical protein lerEdw1_005836 [Lerista edwardsae]
MNHSLQETVEKFKMVMEEMQRKVTTMRLRMDEVYRKINQLEAHERSLVRSNDRLSKELHDLSYQVALFENNKAVLGNHSKAPGQKGNF